MEPMVFVPGGNLSRSDRRDEYMTYLYDGNDARVTIICLCVIVMKLVGES